MSGAHRMAYNCGQQSEEHAPHGWQIAGPEGLPGVFFCDGAPARALPLPQPSVGQIVHYVSYGTPGGEYTSQCRAAVITGVPEGALPMADEAHAEEWDSGAVVCDLAVLNPTGMFFNRCPQSEDVQRGGTWHWPERT